MATASEYSTDEIDDKRKKRAKLFRRHHEVSVDDDDDDDGRSSDSVSSVTAGCATTSSPLSATRGHCLQQQQVVEIVTDKRSTDDNGGQAIYMSVLWSGGRLGVAYYELDTSIMYMMLDAVETHDFQLLTKVYKEVQPTHVMFSCKQDDRVIKVLKDLAGTSLQNASHIEMLPSVDFSLEICKRRLLMLRLPSMPQQLSDYERTLYMTSLIPFENATMVRATGALLKFLARERIGVELEDRKVNVPIITLQTFSLSDLMVVDENTLRALQIFQKEVHPSVYKAGCVEGCKEGLSVYGILNRCKSDIGSKLLRLWLLRPLRNIRTLRERQIAIEFFINTRNMDTTNALQNCLKNIKNVSVILQRMTQAQASISDWQALYKTVYNAIYIRDICQSQPANIYICKKICSSFSSDLQQIAAMINKIVDFEESAMQNRFVVKANVDSELDKKRRTYNGLPSFMTDIAKQELDKLGDEVTECNVVYLPQLGYLLAIPVTEQMDTEKEYAIEGLEFMFFSNKMVHYKSASTRNLDQILGDTQCDINDCETSIMHGLQDSILQQSQVLTQVMQYAAELDCLLALACSAAEGSYCKPHLTQTDSVQINGGRHPLQELCCSTYVPNDCISDEDHGRINILTGPNASGKSIYLKQVALIVYLAHIGSYVPAESASIPMMDRIYSRVSTLESVSVGLSTFMIDLNQISLAVQSATRHSLVVLDEFGKGTNPIAGEALLTACLNHWVNQQACCPHVLASTHFHAITHGHFNMAPQVRFQSMDVLQDGENLVFLYQLVNRKSSNTSYACHVASLAALPQEIINRGKQVAECLKGNQSICRSDKDSVNDSLQLIVELFMKADLDNDDLHDFLKAVLAAAKHDTDKTITE